MSSKPITPVHLEDFLRAQSPQGIAPPLFLTRTQHKSFVDHGLHASGLPPKGTPGLMLTPYPEGSLGMPACWSDDPDYACVPRFRRTVNGIELVSCECWRVGDAEMPGDGAPTLPGPDPIPLPIQSCRLALEFIGGKPRLKCKGLCKGAMRCTRAYVFNIGSGVKFLACACLSIRVARAKKRPR